MSQVKNHYTTSKNCSITTSLGDNAVHPPSQSTTQWTKTRSYIQYKCIIDIKT